MNYLAHLFLSGNDNDLKVGNFIADSLRKSEWEQYSPRVQDGMKLHQEIDDFTDHHPIVEQSKARLRERQHKYSPVVVDIYYDHFLSANFLQYSKIPVEEYAQDCYAMLNSRIETLPKATQHMLPFMIKYNWLVAYGEMEGLQRVFEGMSRRAAFFNTMARAVADLYDDYHQYQREFEAFFPELQTHVEQWIAEPK